MNEKINEIIANAEREATETFKVAEEIAFNNQKKVLKAFQNAKVALRHFSQTTGYGYGDDGRDTLNRLFAEVFDCESALVSPHILSGTHALSLALFGVLRPNDLLLSITGKPYDTLDNVIKGADGSLDDFGVKYDCIELKDGQIDENAVIEYISNKKVRMIFITRSRGYSLRDALSVEQIGSITKKIKTIDCEICIMVDNCYGEFMDVIEPTSVGVDLMAGSLNKNPGGGIVPTGGYICGKESYVNKVAGRLTAPSVGSEIGSNVFGYQYYYQGLFIAPHVTLQATKGSILFAYALDALGYEVTPQKDAHCNDIIRSVKFKTKKELIAFIQAIQKASPVDSFVTLEAWDMPGYNDQVIMAAGCFVEGASIELSADAPVREPYIAYLQGGLTYEHCKCALETCLNAILS